MSFRKGMIIGAFTLATALIPACNPPEKEASVTTREVADIDFPVVASYLDGYPATADDKDALASDNPSIYVLIQARSRTGHQVYYSTAAEAEIGGKHIGEAFPDGHSANAARTVEFPVFQWDESRYGPIEIEWSELVAEKGFYNNTVRGQSDITYKEKPAGKGWVMKPAPGTHRYRVKVRYSGNEIGDMQEISLGKDGKISGIHRVTVRDGNDIPGWMTAWANLPYIYGSTTEQVDNLIGADCADVITGALRRMGSRASDTSSQGFRPYGSVVFDGYLNMQGEFLDISRKRPETIGIRRGDLLVYKGSQHHVAVFADDLTRNGEPVDVVHTYDGKGVHRDVLYSKPGDEMHESQKKLYELFGMNARPRRRIESAEKRLDRIEIIRIR